MRSRGRSGEYSCPGRICSSGLRQPTPRLVLPRAGAARGKTSRGVGCRSPLEQILPGHEYSPERPRDRIQSDYRIMQQEDDGEKPAAQVIPESAQDASNRSAAPTAREPGDKVGK